MLSLIHLHSFDRNKWACFTVYSTIILFVLFFRCFGDIGSGYSGHSSHGGDAAQQIVKVIKITSRSLQYNFCMRNLCVRVFFVLAQIRNEFECKSHGRK